MERPRASSPETVPSPDAVVSVRAEVEAQLRRLLQIEASRQQWEREEKKRKATEAGKNEEGSREKIGWAEAFQQSARGRIQKTMREREVQETETLSDPIVAQMLRDIVETGKIGKNDIPPEFRKVVADFCARKGTPEHWWPAALRAAWCLELGRSLGVTTKPEGLDLLPETRAFLGGLDYEYGKVKKEKDAGVEGRARRTPAEVARRMQHKLPVVRDSAVAEFEQNLDPWVLRPPQQEEQRKAHYAEVEKAMDVAKLAISTTVRLEPQHRNSLELKITHARQQMSRKSGTA